MASSQQETNKNISSGMDSAGKALRTGYQAASEEGTHLIDQFRDATSQVTDRLGKTSKKVSAWTRENPMQAVMVGAGIGFLFGAVIRRALRTKK